MLFLDCRHVMTSCTKACYFHHLLIRNLLQEIAQKKDDKKIIESCNGFVDNIDPEKRYLASRRHITKAKFDTYFSVRTPAEQFAERQQILKNVKWEQYSKIQKDFVRLSEI